MLRRSAGPPTPAARTSAILGCARCLGSSDTGWACALYVFGRRIHEWHLGLAVLAGRGRRVAARARRALARARRSHASGLWLVAKDWPDLTRHGRDTTAWRLGLHRRPLRLRPSRHLDDVPAVAALAVAVVALVDLVSAVTPQRLVARPPARARRAARGHARRACARRAGLVRAPRYRLLPLSAAARARFTSRSVLMAALTVFDLVKGLDFEEAAVDRRPRGAALGEPLSFYVRHEPATLRSARRGGCRSCSPASFSPRSPPSRWQRPRRASTAEILRATGDLLLWQPAPFAFHDELARTGARRRADRPARAPRRGVPALPAARRAARPSRPGAAARGRGARPRARRRHALVLQAPRRQAVPLQPGATAFLGYRDRERRRSWSPATRSASRRR